MDCVSAYGLCGLGALSTYNYYYYISDKPLWHTSKK